jgi:hypothetical protein
MYPASEHQDTYKEGPGGQNEWKPERTDMPRAMSRRVRAHPSNITSGLSGRDFNASRRTRGH